MITELIDLIIDDIKEKGEKNISNINSETIFGSIISNIEIKESNLKEINKFGKM